MTTPRLYLAGPMSGLPEFNYGEFHAKAVAFREAGFMVLNPAEIDEMYCVDTLANRPPWQWYMRKALRMVCDADGVALLDGWQHSRGAMLEVAVGKGLTLPVHPWDVWLACGLAGFEEGA